MPIQSTRTVRCAYKSDDFLCDYASKYQSVSSGASQMHWMSQKRPFFCLGKAPCSDDDWLKCVGMIPAQEWAAATTRERCLPLPEVIVNFISAHHSFPLFQYISPLFLCFNISPLFSFCFNKSPLFSFVSLYHPFFLCFTISLSHLSFSLFHFHMPLFLCFTIISIFSFVSSFPWIANSQ